MSLNIICSAEEKRLERRLCGQPVEKGEKLRIERERDEKEKEEGKRRRGGVMRVGAFADKIASR